jgi:hypothetical protein
VFEVTDYDNTFTFFRGSREDCEKFIRRYGD